MQLQLFTIITIFHFVISNSVVNIKEITLNCNRDVTQKILCEINGCKPNAVIEIIKVQPKIQRLLTNEELKDATELEISIEKLKNMPFGIGNHFYKLEALWIIRSNLNNVDHQHFVKLQHLMALNLYENKIEHLPSNTFQDLPNLEFIDLDDNLISELHEDLLVNQQKLLVFRASNNKIEKIPKNLFKENFKIKQIHLNNNQIREVLIDFRQFLELIVIDFDENAGNCSFNVGYYDNEDVEKRNIEILKAQAQFYVEQNCRLMNEDEVIY